MTAIDINSYNTFQVTCDANGNWIGQLTFDLVPPPTATRDFICKSWPGCHRRWRQLFSHCYLLAFWQQYAISNSGFYRRLNSKRHCTHAYRGWLCSGYRVEHHSDTGTLHPRPRRHRCHQPAGLHRAAANGKGVAHPTQPSGETIEPSVRVAHFVGVRRRSFAFECGNQIGGQLFAAPQAVQQRTTNQTLNKECLRWDVNNFEWTRMEIGILSQSISREKLEHMKPYENEMQIHH